MRGSDTSLYGRDDAVTTIRASIDGLLEGRGGIVTISGEAGIGKSSLAAAVAREAEARGAIVTWGRAWEFADAPPYFPLWPCLRAIGIDPKSSTEREPFFLWERVLEAMVEAARTQPIVWMVEDLHAADLQTLDLLAFLTHPLRSLRALVIVTTREHDARIDERARQRLTRMARDGRAVRLGVLDLEAIAALANQWARRSLPRRVIAHIAERTAGNPLFVIECARVFEDPGSDGRALTALPASVREVVLERVAHLPESTRDVLTCGAIVGREFSAALVARMRHELPAKVIDAALPALRTGLLMETKPGHFQFAHVLVRDAIEEGTSAETRALLHGRAADALEGDSSEVLVERARHALGASSDPHAVALAERAARLLEEQGAFDRAFALLRRIEEVATFDTKHRLHVAEIAHAAGRHADCQRICNEVLVRARKEDDADTFARAALLMGVVLRPGIVDAKLVAALEEALAKLPDSGELHCRVLARLAAARQPAADPNPPMQLAREAVAKARTLNDTRILCEVIDVAGSALVDYAPRDERIALFREQHETATAIHDEPRALRALARIAFEEVDRGDFSAFERTVEMLLDRSAKLGHPRHRWRPLLLGSMRAVALGDFATSERHVVELEQVEQLIDDPALQLCLPAHLTFRARHQHDEAGMEAALAHIAKHMEGIPDSWGVVGVIRLALHTRREDVASAKAELARLGPVFPALEADTTFCAMLGEGVAFVGSAEERRRLLRVITPRAGEDMHTGHVPFSFEGPTRRYMGLLEASLGNLDAARDHLEAALAISEARRHRTFVARLRYELGQLHAQRGDQAAASRCFDEAAHVARDIGLAGLVARCDQHRSVGPAIAPATVPRLRLTREGDMHLLEHGDRSVRVRDSRGMRLLARLIERPGEEIHVLTLASDEGTAIPDSDAGEHLDARARRAYTERLDDLRERLEEAERHADRGRIEALRRERDALVAELSRAVGLGGDARRAGSSTERARVNVQRRIKDAIARVAEASPALGKYLTQAVRTGTYCSFRP